MSGEPAANSLAAPAPWTEADVLTTLRLPLPAPRSPLTFPRISTDTRSLGRGDLFVALKGDRFDGHDHLAAARAAGAAAAVVRAGTPPVEGLLLLPVPDTLRALGDLARARRRAEVERLAGLGAFDREQHMVPRRTDCAHGAVAAIPGAASGTAMSRKARQTPQPSM